MIQFSLYVRFHFISSLGAPSVSVNDAEGSSDCKARAVDAFCKYRVYVTKENQRNGSKRVPEEMRTRLVIQRIVQFEVRATRFNSAW